jgi:hypothetical protein
MATSVAAESSGRSDYRCTVCGYGVVRSGPLPACPMCGSSSWAAGPRRQTELERRPEDADEADRG